MELEEVRKLQRMCVQSLQSYIRKAQNTCSLLEATKEFPLSTEAWLSTVEQRNTENSAHERYRLVREQLFKALRPAARTSSP